MIELASPSREEIEKAVKQKKSFSVYGISGDLLRYSTIIENAIEINNMSCRIRTRGRTAISVASLAAVFVFGIGLIPLAAQTAHNMATRNRDWDIVREPFKNRINVKYCRIE